MHIKIKKNKKNSQMYNILDNIFTYEVETIKKEEVKC